LVQRRGQGKGNQNPGNDTPHFFMTCDAPN
jgi:hypothetical protein